MSGADDVSSVHHEDCRAARFNSLPYSFSSAKPNSTLSKSLESIKGYEASSLVCTREFRPAKRERTIESQIVELKRQIRAAGDVLVQDYVDDGYSGAQLNRPALDQLRSDLKTPHFDTIYFLNTDRIARDVTYQNIIISEILKHRKQIIINGKDYAHNPENKFTLTVLGAVAELERAKMIERVTRGKQLRLAQGQLLGAGCTVYGYDYIRRTAHTPAQYAINQREAAIVQYVFSAYAKGQVGLKQVTRSLEHQGVLTKTGKTLWRTTLLKCMLRNEMYTVILR